MNVQPDIMMLVSNNGPVVWILVNKRTITSHLVLISRNLKYFGQYYNQTVSKVKVVESPEEASVMCALVHSPQWQGEL